MNLFNLKKKRLILPLVAMCFVLLCTGAQSALAKADRYFVDYENNTGYYVDVNSIGTSDHEVVCDLYLVKLHGGYMYRYQAHFDTLECSYEYQNAKIYDYETKKLISSIDFLQPKQSYAKNDMLKQVVEFALEWKRTHIHNTPYGERWE